MATRTQAVLFQPRNWLAALLVLLFLLALFFYWFAVADRYAVFLYGHSATNIPPAQPFDAMTSSRYWMAGLVASGAVLVGYAVANWGAGQVQARRGRRYRPPQWAAVWALCVLPLAVGVYAITTTANAPVLPPALAAACVVSTLAGLALALWPGAWAAQQPVALLWLLADGAGLMPVLLLLRVVELPGRGLSLTQGFAMGIAFGAFVASAAWLALMSWLRRWRRRPTPGAVLLLAAGLSLSYLLMPLAHYLVATPAAYRYITASSNFFAFSLPLQLLILAVAAALAAGTVRLRRRRSRNRPAG